jgi:GNAT superfamily N-acetyltransferase
VTESRHQPANMSIRRLEPGDLEALLALYLHLHSTDTPLPEREIVQAIWSELMANSFYRYYGGFVHAQLVCSCNLCIVPNLTRSCRPFGVIENVVTHADFRRKGYGKAILAHALRDAWSAGCYKVMLSTGRKDEATFRFYEQAGFDRHDKQAFTARPRS